MSLVILQRECVEGNWEDQETINLELKKCCCRRIPGFGSLGNSGGH